MTQSQILSYSPDRSASGCASNKPSLSDWYRRSCGLWSTAPQQDYAVWPHFQAVPLPLVLSTGPFSSSDPYSGVTNPRKSWMVAEITFFQTLLDAVILFPPMNFRCFYGPLEWWVLSWRFSVSPDPPEETFSVAARLYRISFFNNRAEALKSSLDLWGCRVVITFPDTETISPCSSTLINDQENYQRAV